MSSAILKGSLLAILAFFFMAIFGVFTKVAMQTSPVIWVSFIAYTTGAFVLLVTIIPKGFQIFKSDHYLMLIGRAVFGIMASFLYSFSINYIPLVNDTLLFNTAPIFIPILSILFLKRKIEKSIWIAVLIGFLGIIAIIRPTPALFSHYGNLVGLASGLSLAIAYMLMKELATTEPAYRIIIYYLGIGACLQLPFIFFSKAPDLHSLIFSILSGLALLVAQLLLVKAYTYASASQLGVYQYTSVVFVGILDWAIWNVIPNEWDLIGIVLVTLAGFFIIRSKSN